MGTLRAKRLLLCTLWVALAGIGPANAVGSYITPSASLEPNPIGLGQVTTLTITVETSGLSDVRFEPRFKLENLEKVSGASRAQKVSFVNGRVTRSDSLSWRLRPTQAGVARVFGMRVEIDTKIFVLDDIPIEISEEPVEVQRQPGAVSSPFAELDDLWDPFGRRRTREPLPVVKPKVFLRAEVSPRKPFAGQQVLYTLFLFTQADVAAIDPIDMPDFHGAWSQEVPQPEPRRVTMTKVQDVDYGRVVLLRRALFPLRDGPLEIDPIRARMVIKVPERSWLGPLMSRAEEIERTSNSVSLEVLPLPDAPTGFRGAVGQLELESRLEPQQLEVGQAATLELSLSGTGHIQGLPAPDIPELNGVRRFPPEQSGSNEILATRVHGQRSWTYVLVPDRPGEWSLPEIRYPFFDPVAGEFREAATKVIDLRVLPRETGATDRETAVRHEAKGEQEPTESASALDTEFVAGSAIPRPSPWLWTLAALLPLLVIFVLRTRLGGQRREDSRELKDRLREAAKLKSPRRAVDEIEACWKTFLAHRWELEETASPAHWGDLLEAKGASPETVEQMDRLAEDLDYLRHAPELAASDMVRAEILDRSTRLLRALA
ncbi:MAG: BatD family protein [Acidobacteriota bacterium]|nr:BatD family protein [Acidobacteriota bacterium]